MAAAQAEAWGRSQAWTTLDIDMRGREERKRGTNSRVWEGVRQGPRLKYWMSSLVRMEFMASTWERAAEGVLRSRYSVKVLVAILFGGRG